MNSQKNDRKRVLIKFYHFIFSIPEKLKLQVWAGLLACASSYYSPSHISRLIQWSASSSTHTVAGAAPAFYWIPY